jgi:hypothetical protein
MLLHEINYNYEQLLAALERHLTAMHKLPFTQEQRGDLVLMQKGAIEYFYLLTDWQPQGSRDVQDILNKLENGA